MISNIPSRAYFHFFLWYTEKHYHCIIEVTPMDNFNFESLNIFLTVSKFRSFSRASNYLYLDSSTISKKIRQLEKAVNRQLFARTNQGMKLISAGVGF